MLGFLAQVNWGDLSLTLGVVGVSVVTFIFYHQATDGRVPPTISALNLNTLLQAIALTGLIVIGGDSAVAGSSPKTQVLVLVVAIVCLGQAGFLARLRSATADRVEKIFDSPLTMKPGVNVQTIKEVAKILSEVDVLSPDKTKRKYRALLIKLIAETTDPPRTVEEADLLLPPTERRSAGFGYVTLGIIAVVLYALAVGFALLGL